MLEGRSVRIIPSDKTFSVAEGQSVLTAAYVAGIKLPNGCRMGTCKTCRGRIIEGQVDHGHSHATYLPHVERDQGYALLCQARPLTDIVVEAEELPQLPDPSILPAYIRSINRIREDVAILRLRLPLHSYVQFAAGQYVDIILSNGKRRAYSIANAPEPQGVIDLELHIRHMPGGLFTDALFSTLKERDRVAIEVPLGTFFLREGNGPVVMLATGTGYAPIRSIILDALRWGEHRPITLYWGARTKTDLYLLEEAEELARNQESFTFVPVLSKPRQEDDWTGRVGHVQHAVMEDIPDLAGYQVYACGSPAMINSAKALLPKHHLGSKEFYSDAFVTEADVLSDS